MKHIFFILVLNLSACRCAAEDLSAPTNEFVRDLFENPEIQPDFRDCWKGSPDGTSARDDPNGGYLFRFELRFTDGIDQFVFIATDRFGIGHESPPWRIYQKTPTSQWREIGRDTIIQPGSILVHHPSRRIIRKFPPQRDDPTELGTYVITRIDEDGKLHEESYRSDQLNEGSRVLIENESLPFIPEIKKIPLAAFLRSPQAKWRTLSKHGMAAQSLDPGDAPLLTLARDMQWNQAVEHARALTGKPLGPGLPEANSGEKGSFKSAGSSSATKPAANEPVSATRWPTITAVILAAFGVLWVLIRGKRRQLKR